jgi:acetyltransferase-like isoleucine patch superfamily enzyme
MLQGDNRKGIKIGNNVWLGGNVIILDGVTIGNNCVIGAGSVITKNIPSNTKIICKNQQVEEIIYR